MALRISSSCELQISQDNVTVPQELTFSSGKKTYINSSSYNESAAKTFLVDVDANDMQIDLGSIAVSEIMFLLAKGPGLSVKLVPQGGTLINTPAMVLLENAPAILPFKIEAVYVSNSDTAAQTLIIGAAGN